MKRASKIHAAGSWKGSPSDRVVLDYEDRHRRRIQLFGEGGLRFLLDLAETTHLAGGDALELDDGQLVEVIAAPEDLVEIGAQDMNHLVRIAWHLGNRHLPTQLLGETLRIRRDHVIEQMVRQLGGKLSEVKAAFDPEGGAYGHGRTSGHDDHHHAH
ncbi:MAG: urease accessory protein UreE [Stappiaceae bacterium]